LGWGSRATFLGAAGDTYARAAALAAAVSVNWLLVYDLLGDTQDCLQCADDPGAFRHGARARYWGTSGIDSPAWDLLAVQAASSNSWSGGTDASSSDSGSSFSAGADSGGGGFGGGDCGGGGSSSDY
jgi:hypothetical protein